MNISLRLLHIRNQAEWKKPFIKGFQSLLRDTPLGTLFFNQLANSKVGQVLRRTVSESQTRLHMGRPLLYTGQGSRLPCGVLPDASHVLSLIALWCM